MNKITIHAGVFAFNIISFSVACGVSTQKDISGFGHPAYIGGDLRFNFKN